MNETYLYANKWLRPGGKTGEIVFEMGGELLEWAEIDWITRGRKDEDGTDTGRPGGRIVPLAG